METVLIKAAQLILAFVILVTVHEFGHYIFARIFGMRVSKFYLFFNPWFSLLKYDPRKGTLQIIGWTKKVKNTHTVDGVEKTEEVEEQRALWTVRAGKPHPSNNPDKPTWRDTIYGLGWLPLGGYCAIDGMIDETTDSSQLSAEPKPYEFRAKKAGPRLLVMMAGVIMNFLLAIVIFIGVAWVCGDRAIPFDKVDEGWNFQPELAEAGFQNGDKLIAIDDELIDHTDPLVFWKFIQDGARITFVRNYTDTMTITIPQGTTIKYADPDHNRAPIQLRLPVVVAKCAPGESAEKQGIEAGDRMTSVNGVRTPSYDEFSQELLKFADKTVTIGYLRDGKEYTADVEVNGQGKIGIYLTQSEELYPFDRIHYTFFESIPIGIERGVDYLVAYVSSLKMLFTKEGAKSVGGFGAIADMYNEDWNWEDFWYKTAFLSVILAFMNILPIPALDGGHVMFTLYEIITRRKPSEKFLEYAQICGMIFLLLLLVYANFNDIYRFFIK